MANPQKEDGHIQVANEIVEALVRTPIPGTEMRLVLHVLRKTYGFGKKRDWISISQFAAALGIDHKSVCRSTKRLIALKILEKSGKEIGINKNWETWQVVASAPLATKPGGSGVHASGKSAPEAVASAPHTKDSITKDIVSIIKKSPSKKKTTTISETTETNKGIGEIIEVFKKSVSPSIRYDHKGHRSASERLIGAHGLEKVLVVARYAVHVTERDRYAPVITNPTELELKWDKLKLYYDRERSQSGRGGIGVVS